MKNLQLPANVRFSDFRKHPEKKSHDVFDIIVNGCVVHTMDVDCSLIQGSSSEELVYCNARRRAKNWLMERHLLPKAA